MPDPQTDPLEVVVQRMLDTGLPEEQILSIIQQSGGDAARADVLHRNLPRPEDTFSGGFHAKLKDEPIAGGATGFVEGLPHGIVEGAKGLIGAPLALLKEGIGTLYGAGNLLSDPVGTLSKAYDSVKHTAGEVPDAIKSALDLAASDPEEFGRMIGNLTGQAETGIAASKLVPLTIKPAAKQVGSLMEATGSKGKWPIRMMGAHQLGSGNPLGIATMMLPEALQKGGESLMRYGTKPGEMLTTPEGRILKLESDLKTGTMTPQAVQGEITLHRQTLARRLMEARLPKDIADIGREQNALDALEKMLPKADTKGAMRFAAQKEKLANQFEDASRARDANLEAVAQAERDKAGLTSTGKKVTETVKGAKDNGRSVSSSETFTSEPPEGGLSPEQEELLKSIEARNTAIANRQPAPAVSRAPFGGERTTGQFEEGPGGLSNPPARYPMPDEPRPAVAPVENASSVPATPPNLKMQGREASTPEMIRDVRERVKGGVGGNIPEVSSTRMQELMTKFGGEAESTSTAPVVAGDAQPAIRVGGQGSKGLSLTASNFEPLAQALKEQFGAEIEQLRTMGGSLPTAQTLRRLHPDELGNLSMADLQKLVEQVSGGESGLLPTGVHPETGKPTGRGMADVDRRMEGMSREEQIDYYLKLPANANGAIRNYLRRKIWPKMYP